MTLWFFHNAVQRRPGAPVFDVDTAFRHQEHHFCLAFSQPAFQRIFVLIMKATTLNIHPALIEAAKIDGASEFISTANRHAASLPIWRRSA